MTKEIQKIEMRLNNYNYRKNQQYKFLKNNNFKKKTVISNLKGFFLKISSPFDTWFKKNQLFRFLGSVARFFRADIFFLTVYCSFLQRWRNRGSNRRRIAHDRGGGVCASWVIRRLVSNWAGPLSGLL